MIIDELEKKYSMYAKENSLEISLDELDAIFFIRDYVQREGYISNFFGRMICYRIAERYKQWILFIHKLVMPNPGSLLDQQESILFENKDELVVLLHKLLELKTRYTLIGLDPKISSEVQFIRDSVSLWKSISPDLLRYVKSINTMWKEKKQQSSSSFKERMAYSG